MVVEVVTPDELPRFEGTPSGLRSSGSQTPSPADGKGAVTQAPPPKPRPQPQQETQQRPNPQREAKEVPPPPPPAPEATQAEICEVIQFLADKGAKLDEKDGRGRTPIDIADRLPIDKGVDLLTALIIKSGGTPKVRTKR